MKKHVLMLNVIENPLIIIELDLIENLGMVLGRNKDSMLKAWKSYLEILLYNEPLEIYCITRLLLHPK